MSHPKPELRRMDAARLLRSLPMGAVSLLITDPPYDTVDRHGGQYLRRWFRGSLNWPQIGRILRIARRRLATGGQAMVLTNEAGLPAAQAAVRAAGFGRQRLVVWDKQLPGLGSGLRHQVEYVVVGLQPGSRTLAGRDLVSVPAVASRVAGRYPTEKPVELGRQLAAIAGVRRGDFVVDPFCGSGNLLVGAVERGARVIAGDTSVRAVRLATARLAAAARGRPSLEGRSRKAATAYRNSARRTPPKRSTTKAKTSRTAPVRARRPKR